MLNIDIGKLIFHIKKFPSKYMSSIVEPQKKNTTINEFLKN